MITTIHARVLALHFSSLTFYPPYSFVLPARSSNPNSRARSRAHFECFNPAPSFAPPASLSFIAFSSSCCALRFAAASMSSSVMIFSDVFAAFSGFAFPFAFPGIARASVFAAELSCAALEIVRRGTRA